MTFVLICVCYLTLVVVARCTPVADQQRRAQVGHRDSRGDLQHAHAAGGAGS